MYLSKHFRQTWPLQRLKFFSKTRGDVGLAEINPGGLSVSLFAQTTPSEWILARPSHLIGEISSRRYGSMVGQNYLDEWKLCKYDVCDTALSLTITLQKLIISECWFNYLFSTISFFCDSLDKLFIIPRSKIMSAPKHNGLPIASIDVPLGGDDKPNGLTIVAACPRWNHIALGWT